MYKLGKLLSRSLKPHANKATIPQLLIRHTNHAKTSACYSSSATTMKVTILGGAGNVAKSVALMLKQTPLIDELCLYDTKSLEGFASDLNYIDTKCKVTSYMGTKDIQQALSKSSIVVVFACCRHSDNFSYSNLFDKNVPLVKELAASIAKYAPKALVAIGAEPINSMVPMFSEVMKKHGHYNPCTIFGITTINVVRANKFVADVLGLDPECVLVPIIGGHSEKTIVPVLSKAMPCNELTHAELEDITKSIQEADNNLVKVRSDGAYLSYAFATSRFVMNLVKGVKGYKDIALCAYVKCNIHPQLKYMVIPIQLGPGGIAKTWAIPDLSEYESCLLENAVPLLMEDIKKGEFVGGRPMKVVDGTLQEEPPCDPCDANPKAPRCPPDHCEIQSLFANKPC